MLRKEGVLRNDGKGISDYGMNNDTDTHTQRKNGKSSQFLETKLQKNQKKIFSQKKHV